MKKVILLVLSLILLGLTSCSENSKSTITGPEVNESSSAMSRPIIHSSKPVFSGGNLVLNGSNLYAMDLGPVFLRDPYHVDKLDVNMDVSFTLDGMQQVTLVQADKWHIKLLSKSQIALYTSAGTQYINLTTPLVGELGVQLEKQYKIHVYLQRAFNGKAYLTISQKPITEGDWNLHFYELPNVDLLNIRSELHFLKYANGKLDYIKCKRGRTSVLAYYPFTRDLSDTTGNFRNMIYSSDISPL